MYKTPSFWAGNPERLIFLFTAPNLMQLPHYLKNHLLKPVVKVRARYQTAAASLCLGISLSSTFMHSLPQNTAMLPKKILKRRILKLVFVITYSCRWLWKDLKWKLNPNILKALIQPVDISKSRRRKFPMEATELFAENKAIIKFSSKKLDCQFDTKFSLNSLKYEENWF